MHHEIEELSNSHLIEMGTEIREYNNWYTSETDPAALRKRQRVMGDVIVEFTRAGEVVWGWKALDHIDPYRIGYETLTANWINRGFPRAWDWSHGNGFFHDERADSLLISFRMQDVVVKVDRKTGEIVWTRGDHSGPPPTCSRTCSPRRASCLGSITSTCLRSPRAAPCCSSTPWCGTVRASAPAAALTVHQSLVTPSSSETGVWTACLCPEQAPITG